MEIYIALLTLFLIVNQGRNMKKTLFFTFLTLSFNLAAEVNFKCDYKQFNIQFMTNREEEISMELFKGNIKIMSCQYRVKSYEEGVGRVGMGELLQIEKKSCQVLFDKIAKDVEMIEKGFIKYSKGPKESYAYIIKNEQPIDCLIK